MGISHIKSEISTAPRTASRSRRMLVPRRRVPDAYRSKAVREHGAAIHHQAAAHGQPAASNDRGAGARADAAGRLAAALSRVARRDKIRRIVEMVVRDVVAKKRC